METKINNKIITLKASQGNILYRKEVDNNEPLFVTEIILSPLDSPKNYTEIKREDKEVILKAWEEAHKPIIPQEPSVLEGEILAAESK